MMDLKTLAELDRRLSAKLRLKPEKRLLWTLSGFLAHSGDSWFWLAALFIVWLAGSHIWHTRAALLATGILVLAVLVLVVKFSVRRSRPSGDWGSIYRSTDPHSFPSGHAARSALITVMAFGLGTGWPGLLILLWAPLVSLARVAMSLHYLSDVVAGIVLGIGMGLLILVVAPMLIHFFPFVF